MCSKSLLTVVADKEVSESDIQIALGFERFDTARKDRGGLLVN